MSTSHPYKRKYIYIADDSILKTQIWIQPKRSSEQNGTRARNSIIVSIRDNRLMGTSEVVSIPTSQNAVKRKILFCHSVHRVHYLQCNEHQKLRLKSLYSPLDLL